ncbi:putative disintegrin and metalloproteinase domain-containing protein 5 [Notechis scutatus]|uniref:Disintegrin and metalloproteinase domain-containing protein 5 n=1 Tax=Notechis scutatus TaxID=8663 RepID=A0A6J1VLQ1_9SAUR|nr:putative disintegrin and metalloproteinase domain-containing protein 5 [Notechis scutatus]
MRARPQCPLHMFGTGAQKECQTFLHITYPLKIPANSSEDCIGSAEDESVQAYTLTIEKKHYTVYLKQQSFLPNDFMIYTYNPGGFVQPSIPDIQNECFYEGYIQGFPNSVAILSICSGLRGVIQFENVSYGIEHLESSTTFEHLIYELNSENAKGPIWTENVTHVDNRTKTRHVSYKLLSDTVPLSDTTKSHRYIEVYAVVDKVLFNYLGGNPEYVTSNIVQIIGFVNSFKPRNTICRQALDKNCDFPEYCNGSSAICPGNVYVQNGIDCASNTGFCYGGFCQSADLHCQEFFGSRSRNAPQVCYEVNNQADRFGHCGVDFKRKFKTCSSRDLKCGKLICTYPYDTPYTKLNVPVLYMPVKNVVCVSLDLNHPDGTPNPMMVKEGTKCGLGKICLRQKCESYDVLNNDCDFKKKCSGHGVCNNKRNCHCDPGWAPPDCRIKGNPMGGSIDSGLRYLDLDIEKKAREDSMRTWILLSIFLFLPIIIGSTLLGVKWKRIKKSCFEDDDLDEDSESYTRSEESNTSEKTSFS